MGPLACNSTPFSTISESRAFAFSSTEVAPPKSRRTRLPAALPAVGLQHFSNSATHGPPNFPSACNTIGSVLSTTVIRSIGNLPLSVGASSSYLSQNLSASARESSMQLTISTCRPEDSKLFCTKALSKNIPSVAIGIVKVLMAGRHNDDSDVTSLGSLPELVPACDARHIRRCETAQQGSWNQSVINAVLVSGPRNVPEPGETIRGESSRQSDDLNPGNWALDPNQGLIETTGAVIPCTDWKLGRHSDEIGSPSGI